MINQPNRKNHKKKTIDYRNSSSEIDEEITGWNEFSEGIEKYTQIARNIKKLELKSVDFGSLHGRTVSSPEGKQKVQRFRKTQADFFHKKSPLGKEKIRKLVNTSGMERYTFIRRKSIAELEILFKTLEPNRIKSTAAASSSLTPCAQTPILPEKIGVPIFCFFPRIELNKFLHDKHKF